MKKILTICLIAVFYTSINTAQELAPYFKVGTSSNTMQETAEAVIKALKDNEFTILGAYNPGQNGTLNVIAFTRNDLKNTVVKVKDRGALAGVLKVGLVKKNGVINISYTNPDYIFNAYLRNYYATYKFALDKVTADVKTALSTLGNEFTPFGGTIAATKLHKYHYKVMMPYFTDPVTLNEFASFEEGLKIIEDNLAAKKGQTKKVYKLLYTSQQVAVFGVGLNNNEEGESYFLPKIGEDHIAAMPYEIILQGNKATMLHGKYRLALSWPELTMGTFMKIMSTPGDIEDALKAVTEK